MRNYGPTCVFFITYLFWGTLFSQAAITPTDSLQAWLQTEKSPRLRAQYYVHLADLHPDSTLYWRNALYEANCSDCDPIRRIALKALITRDTNLQDVQHYLQSAQKTVTGKDRALFLAYLRTKAVWIQMATQPPIEVIGRELERLKLHSSKALTPEEQIEWEYLMAESIDCASVSAGAYSDVAKAIPYIEQALRLLSSYPPEQSYDFNDLCYKKLINLYIAVPEYQEKAQPAIDQFISLYEEYNRSHAEGFERPFRDTTTFYSYAYALPLYIPSTSPERATYFYNKLLQLYKDTSLDKSRLYDAGILYFQLTKEYQRALAYCDSFIEYGKKHYRPLDLISTYQCKMDLYRSLGDYENALNCLLTADSLHEATTAADALDKMAEMQTRFSIDKFKLEKITLANRNKLILIIALTVLIAVIIGWAFYQRHLLRKLRRTQHQLIESNKEVTKQSERAQESEKMKTAFIQSMCHEVRTPLNIINGFTNLLLDPTLDSFSKQGFAPIIRDNTEHLTKLLNDMLEMSNLVSSNEPFAMEETPLYDLCRQEINNRVSKNSNPELTYRFECDDIPGMISTHPTYLLTVIGRLLDNATKFTERGSIVLTCRQDAAAGKQFISVADTGIGIAPEKQEWVFERFTKIDSFKPGAGVGLYLCRLIITRMRGTIAIDPNYKDGCRIVIELPL